MVRLVTNQETLANEAGELVRAFFPRETVNYQAGHCHDDAFFILSVNWSEDNVWLCTLLKGERAFHAVEALAPRAEGEEEVLFQRRRKSAMKKCVYNVLRQLTGRSLPYGMLTGVRPLTVAKRTLEGRDPETAEELLKQEYDISPEKARLLVSTALVQKQLRLQEDAAGLYVNIPFCPSRCNYCSFPSELAQTAAPRMEAYLDALERELQFVTEESGCTFDCLYVGGGTPTSLSHSHFARLTEICAAAVKKGAIGEFTVEAGRPDTLDREKLAIMKAAGVTRISINPQTMNDETLVRIGRRHTAEAIVDSFQAARELGFDNINMDLIVGLEGERPADIRGSLNRVLALEPESVTVHVLAKKHASELNRIGADIFAREGLIARSCGEYPLLFAQRDYHPYYLYRQKYMLENLENVGYAKPGKECIYNIRMMDDGCTCWAVGAGAVSKRCYGGTRRIERQANPRQREDYIARLDEILEKKQELF